MIRLHKLDESAIIILNTESVEKSHNTIVRLINLLKIRFLPIQTIIMQALAILQRFIHNTNGVLKWNYIRLPHFGLTTIMHVKRNYAPSARMHYRKLNRKNECIKTDCYHQ